MIVDHAGPSAIFWIGLRGALPALAAGRLIRDAGRRARARIDWLGAALLAAALAALLILMTQGSQLGWTSAAALALAVAAVGFFPLWLAVEARQAAPLVDVPGRGRRAAAARAKPGEVVVEVLVGGHIPRR